MRLQRLKVFTVLLRVIGSDIELVKIGVKVLQLWAFIQQ